MTTSFECFEAFVFEIARLHRALAHEKESDLVIQRNAKFHVPLPPDLTRLLGQCRIIFIRAIGCANGLTNIGGSGEGMWQRAGINQYNLVPPFSQFNRSNNAINPRTNDDCSWLLHPKQSPRTPERGYINRLGAGPFVPLHVFSA